MGAKMGANARVLAAALAWVLAGCAESGHLVDQDAAMEAIADSGGGLADAAGGLTDATGSLTDTTADAVGTSAKDATAGGTPGDEQATIGPMDAAPPAEEADSSDCPLICSFDTPVCWDGGCAQCTPTTTQCVQVGSGFGVQACDMTAQWATPTACPPSAPSCTQGQCFCPSNDVISNGICCASTQTGCSGACVDTHSDPTNCGTCGHACFACSGGVCQIPKAISAGVPQACALLPDGTVQCWTFSSSSGMSSPTRVAGITGATAIAVGELFACAVVGADSHVECWGNNNYGQLGDDTVSSSTTSGPVMVSGLTGVTALAAGQFHVCAVLSGGGLACWGSNAQEQLGTGMPMTGQNGCLSGLCAETPLTVSGLTGVVSVAAGGTGTCVVVSGGTVQCWGVIWYDSTAESGTPVPITELSSVSAVTLGSSFQCALLAGGTVQCFGDDPSNYIGIGGTPAQVPGLTGVTAISAAIDTHLCALLGDGTVQCVGNGMKTMSATPVTVPGISGATAIAAGDGFNCAILSSGAISCWEQ
jgi:hypothetical protein